MSNPFPVAAGEGRGVSRRLIMPIGGRIFFCLGCLVLLELAQQQLLLAHPPFDGRKRRGIGSLLNHLIGDVGVNFGGADVGVPQNLLEGADVHAAVLIHQGSGSVAQLVRGIASAVQTTGFQIFFYNLLDPSGGHPAVLCRKEEGVAVIAGFRLLAKFQIIFQRTQARRVEVDHPLLVALSQQAQGVVTDVAQVDAHQLGHTHPAVEQQGEHTVIAGSHCRRGVLDTVQQLNGFLQCQVFGNRFSLGRGVQIFGRVFLQVVGLGGQIFVQRADGSNLAGTAGGVVVEHVERKMQKIIDVAEADRADKLGGDVVDFNFRQLLGAFGDGLKQLDRFEVAKKGAQLDVIAADRFGRTSLNGFHIKQEFAQNRRTVE